MCVYKLKKIDTLSFHLEVKEQKEKKHILFAKFSGNYSNQE